MTRFILVTGLCAVALAGCGRTLVRETVVEKQPIVQRETVVERPAVTREAIVAGPASCTLGAAAYSDGTLSCQAGYEYRCMNGAWARIAGSAC
jgi:hypothetical protein